MDPRYYVQHPFAVDPAGQAIEKPFALPLVKAGRMPNVEQQLDL